MSLRLPNCLAALLVLWPFAAARGAGANDFETAVRPVLVEHCNRCHGPDRQRGGLRVDSREALLAGGDTGPALVPGDPEKSLLIKAVHYDELEMPPAGKLADSQIVALESWVKAGAAWGSASEAAKPAKLASRRPGAITDADRAWWAFQKPTRPAVPAAGEGWAKTPIDRFIAEKRDAAKIPPAPEADRRLLIRRLTFDLTGLPPTPAEVAAFVGDASPGAYEKLVDRLLASPRYGERQARAWLDLVRYAESDGYRLDAARPNAWRYRDYVVRSFNADKGYDRMAREQLAGDELYPDDPDAALATGYLTLWPYEYNQRDVRTQWSGILNDITDVTADTFLGLGMGCARCHDHKFDPILQKDYYALQAFFSGLSFAEKPVFRSESDRLTYGRDREDWEATTATVRGEIDALLAPVVAREQAVARGRFTADIKAMFAKPRAERTPGEQQLVELSQRQVDYEAERPASRFKAAEKAQKAAYETLSKRLAAAPRPPASPLAMVARDLGPAAAEVVIPGGRKQPVVVTPGFLTALGDGPPAITPSETSSGRRAALAEWLTRPENPLTARVMVNRLWQGHFGVGLVSTASDFGTLGEKPSHPELLDWLATEFSANKWSFKHLHRLIVTSATYRQAALGVRAGVAADADNRLLWRMPTRRLDAEQARDALLAVGGELDLDAAGPSQDPSKPVRSIYTRLTRNAPDALLASLDSADGLTGCAKRNVTVTATQSLLLLNGDVALKRAAALAARVMPARGTDAPAGITAAYELAFGRPPTAAESADALGFLKAQVGAAQPVTPERRKAAWGDFCHALLNSNEFLYLD